MPLPDNGRRRVVIEDVQPSVDDGRFPIKRTPDELVEVKADVFTDGHDLVSAVLRYRRVDDDEDWQEVWMEPLVNDRYCARFVVEEIGSYEFEVEGWVDHFASWRHGLERWLKARQDVSSELLEGAAMIRAAADRATEKERRRLHSTADALVAADQPSEFRAEHVTKDIARLMRRLTDRGNSTRSGIRRVRVDRERARFSTWYEMFPRSAGPDPTRSATFREAASRIPEIADMGFDVLYLPPIHPDRPHKPQGAGQYAGGRARGIPAAHGRSAAKRVATPRSSPALAASKISAGFASRPNATGWKSRSTSPTRSHQIIPTPRSTPSGSGNGLMAR